MLEEEAEIGILALEKGLISQDGLNEVLLIGAGIAAVGAVLAVLLVRASDVRIEELDPEPLPVPAT